MHTQRNHSNLLTIGLALTLALLAAPLAVPAATFTVTNTADAGPGSLRQAIISANTSPGADTIAFNLPGTGVQTIFPLTTLPPLTNAVTLDGYTQPGSQANTLAVGSDARLLIRLDGRLCTSIQPSGLKLNGSGGTVRGLIIVKFSKGIHLETCNGAEVSGNWIGLDYDNLSSGNAFDGVYVSSTSFQTSAGNRIGGTPPAQRNVISANNRGIYLFGQTVINCRVEGNYLGTDAQGTSPRRNIFDGVMLHTGSGHTIGGSTVGARNVISGNGGAGIYLLGTTNITVQGNFIGLNAGGSAAIGNAGDGVDIHDSGVAYCFVGGTAPGAGNYIAGNRNGIFILGANTNSILGNFIGTDPTGTRPLGNLAAGISFYGGAGNLIGGTAAGAANTICYNATAGVLVDVSSSIANRIRGNRIFGNRGLGIDLIPSGVSTNDVLDADSGPNNLQNYPTITNVSATAASVRVQGGLSSAPSLGYTLDFYASTNWDFDGLPEGQTWLGSATVTTDVDGSAAFDATFTTSLAADTQITATATDADGNTSEFSTGVMLTSIQSAPPLALRSSGGTHVLAWPASSGATLERSLKLGTGADWQTVNTGIQVVNGTNYYPLVPTPGLTNAFYRLEQ